MRKAASILLLVGWCMAVVAWQTCAYPPAYLAASWVWAAVASISAGRVDVQYAPEV